MFSFFLLILYLKQHGIASNKESSNQNRKRTSGGALL
ncbi:hypothetical protein N596_07685 [Streptococcus ilei]|nr:hypothetical protein N596_07685 [Streptococcus ilei]